MFDYVIATMQKINLTWVYSTRKSVKPKLMFGKPIPTHVDVSYTHFIPGQEQSTTSNGIDTMWLNGMTDTDKQLWVEEYGAQVYLKIEIDKQTGNRVPVDVLTLEQYEQLQATEQPTTTQPVAQ